MGYTPDRGERLTIDSGSGSMIWIVAVLLGLLLTCHGSSSGGQCSEDIVLSEPLGGGCGDAEGVPHLHEDHHLGSFSPVIANADDIRRQWQNCIRRNRGECSGGSAALEEPRFSLDSPRDEAGHKLFQHLDNLGSGSQDQVSRTAFHSLASIVLHTIFELKRPGIIVFV